MTPPTPLPTRVMLVRSMIALVLAAVAVLGIVGWYWLDTTGRERDTAAALDAARTRTAAVLSYTSATLDAEVDANRGQVTGRFAAELDGLARQLILPGTPEEAATTSTEVVRAAVLSVDPGSVDVLLYLDQTTVFRARPEPVRAATQVVVTMTRVDGQWLVAELRSV
ncbi:MAG: hypothetical protein ACT4RN_18630 [Pseudonocardia sp.]